MDAIGASPVPHSSAPGSTPVTGRGPMALAVACVVVAAVAAAAWAAWLGWDHEYQMVDGIAQGPYEAWQVIGAGATVVVATVAAYLRVRSPASVRLLPLAAAIGFAVPWTVDAAANDDSGLFGVGLVLLLVGITVGLAVVMVLVEAVRSVISAQRRRVRR